MVPVTKANEKEARIPRMIRMSESEWASTNDKAALHGRTASGYIRWLVSEDDPLSSKSRAGRRRR